MAQSSKNKMQNKYSFTLIEVLLALAVIAISITALMRTSAQTLNATSRIKEKSMKHWVAMQAINQVQSHELTLRTGLPSTKSFRAFNQTWYFRARLQPTMLNNIKRITVDVSNRQNGQYTDPLMGFLYEK